MAERLLDLEKAAALFEGWQETMIWSCLQGVMGEIYVDDAQCPSSAMAILNDFCFYAGAPKADVALCQPEGLWHDYMILTPQNDAWAQLICDVYGAHVRPHVRYAIKKEPQCFEVCKLQKLAGQLPDGYILKPIDRALYEQCLREDWSRDLVAGYADFETYQRLGLGIAAVKIADGLPVSGASSYTSYCGGIEIEIDTDMPFRRQGLAQACGARLILDCLEKGLYPSWDAHNKASVALAQKLGYHLSHEYTVYEFRF